jgi:hypothetical protein
VTVHDELAWILYLVKRRSYPAGKISSVAFLFALHASRTTSDEYRRSGVSAVAVEVFMDNTG